MIELRNSRLIIISVMFMISISKTNGQILQYHLHTRQVSTSDNSGILTGMSALYANPAAPMEDGSSWNFGVAAHNRYNTDIKGVSGGAVGSWNASTVGLLVGSYGIEGFNRSLISMSYARPLGASSFLAIQGHYHQLNIEGLGSQGIGDVTLGFWHQWGDRWILSTYILNPLDQLGDNNRLFGKADLSTTLLVSDKLQLFTSLSRSWQGDWSLRPGINYVPIIQLSLYAALNTSPSAISFGVEINATKQFNIDLGMNTHPILGRYLSFGLAYSVR